MTINTVSVGRLLIYIILINIVRYKRLISTDEFANLVVADIEN